MTLVIVFETVFNHILHGHPFGPQWRCKTTGALTPPSPRGFDLLIICGLTLAGF